MAGASARSLTRSVVAFDVSSWTPPDEVLLETSVVAEGFSSDARHHAASALVEAQREWETLIAPLDWSCVELHDVADAVRT